ncbi:MAG: outer membrane lipoprotein carrier protein LolA [Bacteroidetes bacterium]|nr:outer membrane lipoprotein carrier protein LolA [Bacteroidota bacterium]
MKGAVLLFGLILMVLTDGFGQQDARAIFEAKLAESVARVSSLKGDFTQVKNLVFMESSIRSTGTFEYRNNNHILWKYLDPYEYTIEIADGKLTMDDGKNRNEIDMNSTKSFRSMNDLFFKSIKGDVLGTDNIYDFSISEQANTYILMLEPNGNDISIFISSIELVFDKATMLVTNVTLNEQSGDSTELLFSNHRVNE